MPEYFVIRSTTNYEQKKWILGEIKLGRLRQGWFAARGTSLVDRKGNPIAEGKWVQNFSKVVRRWIPQPKTLAHKRYRTVEFASQKRRELSRMLEVPEGARIIVPKLDSNGGDEGFVLARAAEAPRGKESSRGCY